MPADITIGGTVDGVANGHVIRRNGLGNCPGRASGAKEPARHFLAGSDFGESAVTLRVGVDLLGFMICIQLWIHMAERLTTNGQWLKFLLSIVEDDLRRL